MQWHCVCNAAPMVRTVHVTLFCPLATVISLTKDYCEVSFVIWANWNAKYLFVELLHSLLSTFTQLCWLLLLRNPKTHKIMPHNFSRLNKLFQWMYWSNFSPQNGLISCIFIGCLAWVALLRNGIGTRTLEKAKKYRIASVCAAAVFVVDIRLCFTVMWHDLRLLGFRSQTNNLLAQWPQ